ncbi:MAG TPA: branched-chain amino acid ABC transporter permease [Actinomycetota bacterium]|nr:branched-chain amino acid ABC transporter permease [Actinomycetota bacterium]
MTVARLGRFERLPWRRIILVVLGIVVGGVVVIGTARTLTLDPAEGGYSAGAWRDFIVQGAAQGAIFAMIALGYSLVYGILRMINFAHGEVFMAGAFGSFFFADAYAKSGFLNRSPILALAIVTLVAVVVSVGTAVLLERLAYRPLRNAPRLVPLITAIGASLFLMNAFRGFFGPQPYGYPKPDVLAGNIIVLGVTIQRTQLLVLVVALICMIALQWFVAATRTGRSMRAVAQDREIASLMGINVDRVIVVTFAIGGVLAGIAGILFSLTFEQVQFTMGFRPGIAAFTAAVLGGIGSIGGAALGGFVIGLLQAVGPPLLLTGFGIPSVFSLRDAFVFLVLVLVLVFRPGGLLGTGEAEKV